MTDAETKQLALENDRLELENATLRMSSGAWWRKSTVVLAMTAIAAGVWPTTSAIRAHYELERDLALEASKQQHEQAMEQARQLEQVRVAILERLKTADDRLRALRLLLASAPDASLRSWAEAEKASLERELRGPPVEPRGNTVVERKVAPELPAAPVPVVREPSRQPPRPAKAVPATANASTDRMALKDDPY